MIVFRGMLDKLEHILIEENLSYKRQEHVTDSSKEVIIVMKDLTGDDILRLGRLIGIKEILTIAFEASKE